MTLQGVAGGDPRLLRRAGASGRPPAAADGSGGRGPPLADLLAPHRVVQPLLREQLVVAAGLDDAPALQHVDAVGVHHRRQPVGDEDGDHVAARRPRRASSG